MKVYMSRYSEDKEWPEVPEPTEQELKEAAKLRSNFYKEKKRITELNVDQIWGEFFQHRKENISLEEYLRENRENRLLELGKEGPSRISYAYGKMCESLPPTTLTDEEFMGIPAYCFGSLEEELENRKSTLGLEENPNWRQEALRSIQYTKAVHIAGEIKDKKALEAAPILKAKLDVISQMLKSPKEDVVLEGEKLALELGVKVKKRTYAAIDNKSVAEALETRLWRCSYEYGANYGVGSIMEEYLKVQDKGEVFPEWPK